MPPKNGVGPAVSVLLWPVSWLLLSACGARGSPPAEKEKPACLTEAYSDDATYDAVFDKACHNCYDPQWAAAFGDLPDLVQTLEIDIFDNAQTSILQTAGSMPGNWYVRHDSLGENISNCSGSGTLRDCLLDVHGWTERNPDHDVLTIYMDKKEEWAKDRGPADLDALVESVFPRSALFAPGELQGSFSSPREAVVSQGWPRMRDLRGKVILVMTNTNRFQSEYVAQRGADALFFVGPATKGEADITGTPSGFTDQTGPWVVFHNMGEDALDLVPLARSCRRVSRVWGLDETDSSYQEALEHCVNRVALFHFQYPAFQGWRVRGILAPNPHSGSF